MAPRRGENRAHGRPAFAQAPDELETFIGSNSATDDEKNEFVGKPHGAEIRQKTVVLKSLTEIDVKIACELYRLLTVVFSTFGRGDDHERRRSLPFGCRTERGVWPYRRARGRAHHRQPRRGRF